MIEAIWTLEYRTSLDSTEITAKTFDDWNIQNLTIRLVSQGMDTCEFRANYDWDEDLPFAYKGICIIKKDGVGQFFGIVTSEPVRNGGDEEEFMSYTLEGPMWYLQNLVFQQYWKYLVDKDDPTKGFTADPTSHLILMQEIDGTRIGLEAQINEILDWAINFGLPPAPISRAGVDIKNYPPYTNGITETIQTPKMEIRDMSCADAIRKCLRWLTDVSFWWDYTLQEEDVPILHIKRRGFLTAGTIDVTPDADGPGPDLLKPQIRARTDLVRPGVVIKYEKSNTLDGVVYPLPIRANEGTWDAYPLDTTGREVQALVSTIDLEGGQSTTLRGSITCGDVAVNSTVMWFERQPKFNTTDITNVEITAGHRNGTLPRYIIDGTPAQWMKVNGAFGQFFQDYITAKASYDVETEGQTHSSVAEELIDTKVLTTDLVTGNYSAVQVETLGEAIPIGMAKTLYDSVSVLQYEGSFQVVEDECTDFISIGNVLNLTGGRTEWTTMNAQVQQIIKNIDGGYTTVVIGPAGHLGESDIMELLRENRNRLNGGGGGGASAQRSSGYAQTDGLSLPAKAAKDSNNSIGKKHAVMSIGDLTETPGVQLASADGVSYARIGQVTIQNREVNVGAPGVPAFPGRPVTLREIDVWIKSADACVQKKMIVLASELYDP